jgi:hypothetical protein
VTNQHPRALALLLAGLGFLPTAWADELSPAQPSPEEMAKTADVTLPPRPWHMADVWWHFANKTEHFESLSVDVSIDRDIPDSYDLYIAPVGIGQMNGFQFYGGLQTNINGWPTKESCERVFPGKGAIFSRWSDDKKTPIGLGHVRMAADGLCESAGYEGEFCSVRRPFPWTKGSYTYSIVKGDTETIDGKPHTWFHCIVRTHSTGAVTAIGSLRFEGTDFTFWEKNAAFVEVYSTAKIPASGIPKVNVTFGYPRVNGIAPELKEAFVTHPQSGVTASPACAREHVEGSSVVVEVGPIFPTAQQEKHVPLPITAPGGTTKAP